MDPRRRSSKRKNFSKIHDRLNLFRINRRDPRKVWRIWRFPRNDSWWKGVRNEEGGKEGGKERREGVVLIRSPKTFPLDDRLFSTRRDARRGGVNSARFLHPWRSWRIEGGFSFAPAFVCWNTMPVSSRRSLWRMCLERKRRLDSQIEFFFLFRKFSWE